MQYPLKQYPIEQHINLTGFFVLFLGFLGCASDPVLPAQVDFNFHVKPILSDRCYTCHGPDENTREAGLRFDTEAGAFAALDSLESEYAIVPGDPARSKLVERIYHADPEERMPPSESNLYLTDREKALLERWIVQGAVWKQHWSMIAPQKVGAPSVSNPNWIKQPIDAFVLTRLDAQDLSPAPEATREKWIRRVSFDLTGLPPTLEAIDTFLADDSPDAFEKVVDRLFQSSAYGERMATIWLDLARYADTQGHHHDFERNMWPWRDWVIDAYNMNMPYDQFVTWQLAGDLLPDPTYEQMLATAFNRNHKITQECGVIEEEFRVSYVLDRTNTFSTAFLGLTMECAQCHDHKYDPISQKEYYQLFSFFNNIPERGRWPHAEKTAALPNLMLTDAQVAETKDYIAQVLTHRDAVQATTESPAENDFGTLEDALNVLTYPVMIMSEMDTLRPAYILKRGDYSLPGERVFPGTPNEILPFGDEFPANRLGLAQWLFSTDHPLTARVAVNRLWQMLFGTGIVATPEDFGSQGALPSHPELLDWLAVTFQESGWDIQFMLKTMVLSATYRQAGMSTDEKLAKDPDNILLSRGPHLRLSAEMIRDQALALSGLLVDEIGGPPVKPYQPAGLWAEVSSGGTFTRKYVQGFGDDLYRRSLYTFWKRIQPPPAMITFDAATRNQCSVKRQQTSTPLQALVLLNDPQFVEAARVLAERMMIEGGDNTEKRIRFAFRLATSREPSNSEIAALTSLLQDEREAFLINPELAEALLNTGDYRSSATMDHSELAAYSIVASTILNLSETISK